MSQKKDIAAMVKKWEPLLEHKDVAPIKDPMRKKVVAELLENTEKSILEKQGILSEAPINQVGAGMSTGGNANMQGYDPILISLIRRAAPNLIAFDVVGVQPMSGPTGLIFAMKSRYSAQNGAEALFDEADTEFSSDNTPPQAGTVPVPQADANAYTTARGLTTAEGEALGDGVAPDFNEMAFSIEKVVAVAKERKLAAGFSVELAQDLKAVHGLDAESELANILSSEILAEENREIVRTIYNNAKTGAQHNVANAGIFDLDVDSNGRWSVERFKGLMFQIERDANAIAKETRRGKGNIILCSSDVASALSLAGLLDTGSNLKDSLNVDDTGSTFAGVLNGRYKVFIDPYVPFSATNYYVVGYKGANQMDAGLFYCPYVPLQMFKAVDPRSLQPRIGMMTRYAVVSNPFANTAGDGSLVWNANRYYRRVQINNLS